MDGNAREGNVFQTPAQNIIRVWETLKAEVKAQIWTGADLKNKTFAKIKKMIQLMNKVPVKLKQSVLE